MSKSNKGNCEISRKHLVYTKVWEEYKNPICKFFNKVFNNLLILV